MISLRSLFPIFGKKFARPEEINAIPQGHIFSEAAKIANWPFPATNGKTRPRECRKERIARSVFD
jgi:hypothetical protein